MLSKGADKLRSHVESARNREAEAETCYGQRLLREAVPLLVDGIEDWFKQQRKSPNPSNAYHELLQLSPKVVSFIALKSIVDTLTQRRALASAAIKLGALVEDEAHFGAFSEHPNFKQTNALTIRKSDTMLSTLRGVKYQKDRPKSGSGGELASNSILELF